MNIEVICKEGEAKKSQGDALEAFVAKWIKSQGYVVHRNLRLTACEIDLLCKKEVSGQEVYVECKAYNETQISSAQLKQFLGTLAFRNCKEGWFITTGGLGHDAKGFVNEWEGREDRDRMHIYYPERIVRGFIDARLICTPPDVIIGSKLNDDETLAEWTLVIGELGVHWATLVLKNGIPACYVICGADIRKCSIIEDHVFISKLRAYNFSLQRRGVPYWTDYKKQGQIGIEVGEGTPVVEVDVGERWSDYRPSRPEHFVGRKQQIRDVFRFFSNVKLRKTENRIFAVRGDSGIGKSSFVAKIRDEARHRSKPSNVFVFAVDVRAASDLSYVGQSLLRALKAAQGEGYGCETELLLTNQNDPLSSESVARFLEACVRQKQVIVLVFDQFEELYSKSEMGLVFEEAKRLFWSAVSAHTNFVLGFAWKTDCSIPQEHPAYHMWQELADHRYDITLRQFSEKDAQESILLFEKEINEQLRPDLKRYFLDNSQGLPWLLKKLCIHMQNAMSHGISQLDMEKGGLDIASLFDQDLNSLSSEEEKCLRLIASNAPMDWFDATQTVPDDVIRSLQEKRLVLRKGRKLNLYWDIFREYVLHKTLPEIPFNYIPQSASLDALLRAGEKIATSPGGTPAEELYKTLGLSKKTTGNIISDLIRFGFVKNVGGVLFVEESGKVHDKKDLLRFLRVTMQRHKVLSHLRHNFSTKPCSPDEFRDLIALSIPSGQYDTKTLSAYANKMRGWLVRLGYLRCVVRDVIFQDQGDVVLEAIPKLSSERGGTVFIGDASPALAFHVLKVIAEKSPYKIPQKLEPGWRNALSLLMRLGLIDQDGQCLYLSKRVPLGGEDLMERLFARSASESSVKTVIEMLSQNSHCEPTILGRAVANVVGREWKDSSALRIGGGVKIWAQWIMRSRAANHILPPPGRMAKRSDKRQMYFSFES